MVLVRRREGSGLAPEIAPDAGTVGLLLPYSPLHHLLLAAAGRPLVMTCGNLSEEPIAHRDEDALARLSGIADLFLVHDREIEARADDSVARVVLGRPLVMRRARGFVPSPVAVSRPFPRPVLACGAHLKNAFCLASGDEAMLGPHVGDLENLETLRSFEAVGGAARALPPGSAGAPRPRPPPATTSPPATRGSAPPRGHPGRRRPAPPRPRRRGHGRARASTGRCWRSPGTAPASAPTARPGAASCCWPAATASSGWPPSGPCRSPAATAPCGSPGGSRWSRSTRPSTARPRSTRCPSSTRCRRRTGR